MDKKIDEDWIDKILKLEIRQEENYHYINFLIEKIQKQDEKIQKQDEKIQKQDEKIQKQDEKIQKQDEKIQKFESQNHELFMQNIVAQNSESVKELARICKIGENAIYDPRELEGILSAYSDSQSSVEWVRSVRDSS